MTITLNAYAILGIALYCIFAILVAIRVYARAWYLEAIERFLVSVGCAVLWWAVVAYSIYDAVQQRKLDH